MTTTTVADIEQQIAAIDARRAVVTAEREALAQHVANTATTSPATTARLDELGREAARLMHGDRVKAQQQLARLHQRERDRTAMIASIGAAAEHREICARVAELAGELAHVLDGEKALHQQLVEQVGISRLPGLIYADARFRDHLVRLSEIAGVTARARRVDTLEEPS